MTPTSAGEAARGEAAPVEPTRVEVDSGRGPYPVWIGAGLLEDSWRYLGEVLGDRPVAILTHRRLRRMFGARLIASWPEGRGVLWLEVPIGEQAKTFPWLRRCLEQLARARFPRDGVVVALGGGVPGDLAGFVAASWMRGVEYVQVPTTLVSQVDSSVGGKTAINLPQGKNLVGAFHPPRVVLADTATLASLPRRELLAGQAEVVKYALLRDRSMFERLERELPDPPSWDPIVAACVRHKAEVVSADEREAGLRRCLNLGHTLGHAIEAAGKFRRHLHGEAVALGTRFAYRLAAKLGVLGQDEVARVDRFYQATGIAPAYPRYAFERLERWMLRDKKVAQGSLKFVLPTGIGAWRIEADPDSAAMRAAHDELVAEAKA